MDAQLRVLVVEDDEDDALLTVRELERSYPTVDHQRVDTEVSMREALASGQWDVILLDYALPAFDAREAAEIARQHDPDLPVILVSGAIGERSAVDMMRAGVRDYVMKDDLTRLPPAVARELLSAEAARELRRAERELRESEERYRSLFETAQEGIVVEDTNGDVLMCNPAMCEMLGYTHVEMMGLNSSDYLHPEELADAEARRAARLRGEDLAPRLARRLVRKDGSAIDVDSAFSVIRTSDRAIGLMVSHKDVTRELAAQRAMADSEERYRTSVEALAEGLVVYDAEARITEINEEGARLLGAPRSELIGKVATVGGIGVTWLTAEGERAEDAALPSLPAFRTGRPASGEILGIRRPDGSEVYVRANAAPLPAGGSGEAAGVVVTYSDITEQLASERRAGEAAAEVSSIFEVSSDALVLIDQSGTILRVNPATCELFGWEENDLLGRNVSMLMPEPDRGAHGGYMSHYLETGQPATDLGLVIDRVVEATGLRKDGSDFPLELSIAEISTTGRTRHFTGMMRDLTARKSLQAQLLVAQKSEALGTLVAGVAHDFNNLLTAIGGSIDLAQGEPANSRWLENANLATDRAASLVRQLLQFARRDPPDRAPVSLGYVAENVVAFARETFDRRISLEVDVAEDAPEVLADASQIEQVVMNLLVNARDAVVARLTGEPASAGYEPRIAITVANCDSSACACGAGRCVLLAVRDNGTGMSPEVRDRVFDPFFTTKSPGKGTGLGLSTAYGIIAEHQGALTVASEPGEGTTFTLEIPVDAAAPVPAAASGTERAPVDDGGAKGSVLVVEDEPQLLAFAEATLAGAGYEVVAVSNGNEALRIIAERLFDLALVDINMPAPDGWDVLAGIHDLAPETKVLMASGYAVEREVLEGGADGFLEKPYRQRSLLRAVQAYLGESARDTA